MYGRKYMCDLNFRVSSTKTRVLKQAKKCICIYKLCASIGDAGLFSLLRCENALFNPALALVIILLLNSCIPMDLKICEIIEL